MIIEHQGSRPKISESAYIAPTATISGDVTIGDGSCILFGAVITSEGGPVNIGKEVIVMENAVVRGTRKNPAAIGNNVLIGPHAHLTGCTVESNVFIATGASIFNNARLEGGSEVRINGVVHVNSVLPGGSVVPIGWVAVGNPARIFPPQNHDEIWAIQKELSFDSTVFGLTSASEGAQATKELTRKYSASLLHHRSDLDVS